MDYHQYIIRDPEIMLGKPIIKGTRITVELIVRKFAHGYTLESIQESYPHLRREQILSALEYAADVIAREEVHELV
jgi:uncharacterized protein (DUF433 family)